MFKRILSSIVLVAIAGLAVAVMAFQFTRRSAMQNATAHAQRSFQGDQMESLLQMAESEVQPLSERNKAIWTLGELRDQRALSVLNGLNVQEECDHERLVCQREVRKAIRKINGELSLQHDVRILIRKIWEKLGA